MFVEHYHVLGVPRTANHKQIKDAYKRLANLWHPDKRGGCSDAEEKFKHILLSYQVLSDENKRSQYDLDLAQKERADALLSGQYVPRHAGNESAATSVTFEEYFQETTFERKRVWKWGVLLVLISGFGSVGGVLIYNELGKYRLDSHFASSREAGQSATALVNGDAIDHAPQPTAANIAGNKRVAEPGATNKTDVPRVVAAEDVSLQRSKQESVTMVKEEEPISSNLLANSGNDHLHVQDAITPSAMLADKQDATNVVVNAGISTSTEPPVSGDVSRKALNPIPQDADKQRVAAKSDRHNASGLTARQNAAQRTVQPVMIIDDAQIAKWYAKGLGYYSGQGGIQQNYAEAAKWFHKAAEQGHIGAQTLLGTMYFEGKGVLKDRREARKWYQRTKETFVGADTVEVAIKDKANTSVRQQ